MRMLAILAALVAFAATAGAQEYLGQFSANPYPAESTANPFGAGSPYAGDSVTNPYGSGWSIYRQ